MSFEKYRKQIEPLSAAAMISCRKKWERLAKPIHGLGRLEDIWMQIAGIQESDDIHMDKKALVVFCADNGVVAEGVSQTGQEVTAIVAENFLEKKTTAAIMAARAGVDVYPIDIGIARDTRLPDDKKIAYGTANMAREPAMSRKQAKKAVETGIEVVKDLKSRGYDMIATGEMGIGNTTTSSAVAAVLLGEEPAAVTGRGAGIAEHGYQKKIQVIEDAIHRHKPDRSDIIDVLSKVGGYDIAGLAGVFLGGVIYRIPILVDGFISATAALAAAGFEPLVRSYAVCTHVSKECGCQKVLAALRMEPFIHCDMNLGEGTGALAAIPLLEMALKVYQEMPEFEEINIEPYEVKGGC